jgi:hypothetical protein
MSCAAGRTYGASLTALNPGTAATAAIAELDGSATKKIRLLKVVVSGSEATAIAVNDLRLTMLSSISTGGTATTATNTAFDPLNQTGVNAPTAVFRGFTVAPTGGGVVVGAIAVQKLSLLLITTNLGTAVEFNFQLLPPTSRPTLHTAAQAIGIDFNGATPANAPNLDIYAWWTEVPLNA